MSLPVLYDQNGEPISRARRSRRFASANLIESGAAHFLEPRQVRYFDTAGRAVYEPPLSQLRAIARARADVCTRRTAKDGRSTPSGSFFDPHPHRVPKERGAALAPGAPRLPNNPA